MLVDKPGHDLADFICVDLALYMDTPALPGVLVQDGQHPQLAASHGHIVDKVPGPDVIAMCGCGRESRGDALTALPGLLRWNHQTKFPAKTLDLASANIPAFCFE